MKIKLVILFFHYCKLYILYYKRLYDELIVDLLIYINISNKPIKSIKYNLQDKIINLCYSG